MEFSEETMRELKAFMKSAAEAFKALAETVNSFFELTVAGFKDLKYPSKKEKHKPVLTIRVSNSYIEDKRLVDYYSRGNR